MEQTEELLLFLLSTCQHIHSRLEPTVSLCSPSWTTSEYETFLMTYEHPNVAPKSKMKGSVYSHCGFVSRFVGWPISPLKPYTFSFAS